MTSEKIIKTELKNLLRAIAHKNSRDVMKAHKVLYQIGPPSIPHIKGALFGLNLSSTNSSILMKSASELRYVTSLMSLIHDIDENESKKVTQKLIQRGCNTIIIQRLESINSFTLEDYFQYEIRGIPVFEYKRIESKYEIRPKLEQWFRNIPDDDLKEIERIYIVERTEEQDYAGYFMPIFYYIKLVWDTPQARYNPVLWLRLIEMEFTFYHEIGHHIHRSTGEGKLKQEREDEADSYAAYRFISSRPVLYKILWVIYRTVKLFRPNYKVKQAS